MVKKKGAKKNKSNSIAEYFGKVKQIYTNSNYFFKSVEKQDLLGVLRFFAIFYLIYFFISTLVSLIGIKIGMFIGDITLRTIILDFIGFFISSAFVVFIVPLFVYLGLRILKVKKSYLSSFKPIAYGMILNRGYMLLVIFVSLILQIIFPFDMTSITTLQTAQDPAIINNAMSDFFSQTNAIITLIVTGLIVLVAMIHSLIFSIKGLSKFNKISKGKAIGSIVVAIIIALVLIILLGLLMAFLSNGIAPA